MAVIDRGMRLSFIVDDDDNTGDDDRIPVKEPPIPSVNRTVIKTRTTKKKKSMFAVEPDSDNQEDEITDSAVNKKDDEDEAMDLEWEASQMKKVLGRNVNSRDTPQEPLETGIPDINAFISEKRRELLLLSEQLAALRESHRQHANQSFDEDLLSFAEQHYEYLATLLTKQPLDDAAMQEWREKYPSDF